MKRFAPALALLFVFAGCSSAGAATGAGLKVACDGLGPVMHEFGGLIANPARYAAYRPKVQAIADAGGPEVKTAIAPLIAAFDKGVNSDQAAVGDMLAASADLMTKCTAAGSTAYGTPSTAATTTPATSAAPTPSESTDGALDDATLGDLLEPSDFKIGIKILTKQCFGSAGCNVTFRIKPSFVGVLDMPSSGTTEVTYKVKGGDDPLVNTFTIDADGTAHFDSEESISTPRSSSTLKGVVTDVEWNES